MDLDAERIEHYQSLTKASQKTWRVFHVLAFGAFGCLAFAIDGSLSEGWKWLVGANVLFFGAILTYMEARFHDAEILFHFVPDNVRQLLREEANRDGDY